MGFRGEKWYNKVQYRFSNFVDRPEPIWGHKDSPQKEDPVLTFSHFIWANSSVHSPNQVTNSLLIGPQPSQVLFNLQKKFTFLKTSTTFGATIGCSKLFYFNIKNVQNKNG